MTDKQIIIDKDKFKKAENEPINQEAVNKFIEQTDKFYIDECDVSECKYFSKYQKIVRNNECIVDMQNACIEEIKTKPCSQKHNCYFKNWQRKEQECEEWKHQAELGVDTTDRLTKELEEKERECEKLKEELQKYKDREQWEIELNKKCADSFKEMLRMLYGKVEGNSLIEKRNPYEN